MAAEGGFVYDESFSAAASLASNQYFIVKSSGQDSVNLCTGSSGGAAGPRGIVQNDPGSGQAATVRIWGKSKASAGGSVSFGDQITCSTGGQVITATTTGQVVLGWANSASTAAGQVIEVFLTGRHYFTAGATA